MTCGSRTHVVIRPVHLFAEESNARNNYVRWALEILPIRLSLREIVRGRLPLLSSSNQTRDNSVKSRNWTRSVLRRWETSVPHNYRYLLCSLPGLIMTSRQRRRLAHCQYRHGRYTKANPRCQDL